MPAELITPERREEILRNMRLGGLHDLAAELEGHFEAGELLQISAERGDSAEEELTKLRATDLVAKLEYVERQWDTTTKTATRLRRELTACRQDGERVKLELDKTQAAVAHQREVLTEVENEAGTLTSNLQSKVRNALLAFSLLLLIAWNDTPHVLTLQPTCEGYTYGAPTPVLPGGVAVWEWQPGETCITDGRRIWGPKMNATRFKGPGGGYVVRLVEGRP